MVFIQLWLTVTFGMMLLGAVLYAIEVAPGSFRNDGADRQYAKMFFFAPIWPVWVVIAVYFILKYFIGLLVSMWRSLRT